MSHEIIQIIEDDPTQARILDHALRKASYRTNVAHDGQAGLEDVKRLHPALILLDVMLPGLDGRQVCRCLRQDIWTRDIPIIMITALGGEEHRVAALEDGADDYLVKPCSPLELVARVRAVLRRVRVLSRQANGSLNDELVREEEQVIALFRGQRVTLSGQEWRILRRLAGSDGQVVPREELSSLLWDEDGLVHEHELERRVRELSRKLSDDAQCAGAIVTVPGGGYRLTSVRP